jgi:NTP pyrophosphatase (non-canonical NTP hydrolase)
MEIKQAGEPMAELLNKLGRVKLDNLSAQAFSTLVEELGEAAKIKKTAESAPPAAAAGPAPMPELNDEAASNYWQILRLAMNTEDGQEETPEEEADRNRKKRRRKKRS